MTDLQLVPGPVPGARERITEMHRDYYSEYWGFGEYFEHKVSTGIEGFLESYDEQRDCVWTASVDGRIEGSIAVDGSRATTAGAHIRWFIVSDAVRGTGVGSQLMSLAMSFCRLHEYSRVYLWTFSGLDAARHLYESHGFVLAEEFLGTQWGPEVLEQRFECRLSLLE